MAQRDVANRRGGRATLSVVEGLLDVWAFAEKEQRRVEHEGAMRLRASKVEDERLEAWEIAEQDKAAEKAGEAAIATLACEWCRLNSCWTHQKEAKKAARRQARKDDWTKDKHVARRETRVAPPWRR